ncbi:MAG: GtrA family protein [Alkalibacterium sp.]|nr:GtrA family protein [Alkalibacterium sp.]
MNTLYNRFHQFIDYFLFGVITASLNISLFFTLHKRLGLNYLLANAIAVTMAMVFSYVVNKKFVFHTKMTTKRAVVRECMLFLSMRGTAAVMDIAGIYILVQFIRLGATLSKVIIEILIASSNYFVSKKVIFKKE